MRRDYDANKKIADLKRDIAVDTDGRLLMVNLTTADIADSTGARAILDAIRKRRPWVKHLFTGGVYARTKQATGQGNLPRLRCRDHPADQ